MKAVKKLVRFCRELQRFRRLSPAAFGRALKSTKIELPKGQVAYVLRHSFASHFVTNGGDILTLQKVLGHSTINMSMRYSNLSEDYLSDALRRNPRAFNFQ